MSACLSTGATTLSPLFRPLNEVEEFTTIPGNYLSLSFTVGARTTLVIRKTDKLSDVLSYQESAAQHKTGIGTHPSPIGYSDTS